METWKCKPNYYAILPAPVRYDVNLTDSEKLLFAEITALARTTGRCWATNKYFASVYNTGERTIRRRISKLIKLGYLEAEMRGKLRYIKIKNVY